MTKESSPTIDRLEVSAYAVPTDSPEADGTIDWNSTTMVMVRAFSGNTAGTGWTYGSVACGEIVRSTLAPLIEGTSALDIGAAWTAMVRGVRNIGRPGVAGYAISAVDIALWDLKARILDLPLHHMLGAVSSKVKLYGSGGFTTYSQTQLQNQLTDWREKDIPRVKIKIAESRGTRVKRDLARMAFAREVIGNDCELFVDANGGYTRKQAIRVMNAASDFNIHWLEEPVSSDDLDGLREIRDAVEMDVAAGEYGSDISYFRRMCQAEAVDCLQIDASRCGGITEWLRAAAVAASFQLDVSAHCGPHLHVHAAAATPNFRHLEWFWDHTRIEEMFFEGALDPTGGMLTPDSHCAGNGLEPRFADMENYRVA